MREGKLLRARPGLLIVLDGRNELSPPSRIALPGLGDGVVLRLTLTRTAPGRRTIGCLNMTQGPGWTADYAVELDTAEHTALIQGRAPVRAPAGPSYRTARVRLVAGSVNRHVHRGLRLQAKWRCGLPPWRRTPSVSAVPLAFPNCRSMSCRAGRIYVLALKRKWSCLTPPVYRFRKPTD